MPSTIGTVVAANYRQQQVPYSRFGTRKIVFFNIGYVDTRDANSNLDDVEFNKLIDSIQTLGEIVMVGAPRLGNDYGRFIVALFEDTFNNGNNTLGIDGSSSAGYNSKAKSLQTVLEEATDGDVDVEQIYMYGGPGSGQTGWESDDTYTEYDTRAEFLANSYAK